jgi:capsular polysaccharide biosynthesis protein
LDPVELREYWTIVRRRWWLPLAITLVAFVASTVVGIRGAAAYRTDLRVAVSTLPSIDPRNVEGFDAVYYSNLTSEYLADDMSEFIHSEAFAGEVRRELATARGMDVDVNYIINATRTKKTHRFIDVTVMSPTFEEGQELAGSISRILNDQARMAGYLQALTAYTTQMRVITPPATRRANTGPGLVSEIGLRTLVGLLVGIGLAFLVHYVDPSVRSRQEVEDLLRLPVLGAIPRAGGRAAA